MRAELAGFVGFLKTKSKLKAREFGFATSKIKLSADVDESLEDFKEYMLCDGLFFGYTHLTLVCIG